MKNRENDRKLYSSKKFFFMATAILISSVFAGYQAYDLGGGSVKAGLCSAGIGLVIGISIVLWVVYHGNKKGKN